MTNNTELPSPAPASLFCKPAKQLPLYTELFYLVAGFSRFVECLGLPGPGYHCDDLHKPVITASFIEKWLTADLLAHILSGHRKRSKVRSTILSIYSNQTFDLEPVNLYNGRYKKCYKLRYKDITVKMSDIDYDCDDEKVIDKKV